MFRGFNRGRGRHGGTSRQNLGLALLAFQIFQFGIDRIPLVTLVTLLTNIGVYLKVPKLFDIHMPQTHDVCISYQGVVVYREYSRLILSGFYHLTDMHLYYNMASLLYKGTQLEPRLGSARFASVIGGLTVGSSAVYCALQFLAAQFLGAGQLHSCAAGFSCVLFGLKVILQHGSPPSHRLFGIPIHMAYWSELLWISVISPNVSFVGHLAGIVTGLLITHGPLNFLLTGTLPAFFEGGGIRNDHTWGTGVNVGTAGTRPRQQPPRDDNIPANLNAEEEAEFQEAIRRSLEETNTRPRLYPDLPPSAPPYPGNPSAPPHPPGNPSAPSHPPGNPSAPSHPPGNPSAPPHPDSYSAPPHPGVPPQLPVGLDEIRRRRLQRFQ